MYIYILHALYRFIAYANLYVCYLHLLVYSCVYSLCIHFEKYLRISEFLVQYSEIIWVKEPINVRPKLPRSLGPGSALMSKLGKARSLNRSKQDIYAMIFDML